MADLGRWLIVAGVVIALGGLALWAVGRTGFRGLPGDIKYEGENVRFYFPIVTSLVLSALLTLGLWLWHLFTRR